MSERPLYKIDGFKAPKYAFGLSLLSDFAKITFEEELPESFYERIIGEGKRIVEQNFPSYFTGSTSIAYEPYIFAENEKGNLTCLVSHLKVPGRQGDAHALDLEEVFNLRFSKENDYVNYVPHNIEGWEQAHTLLLLWLTWISNVNLELNGKHGDLIERFTYQQGFSSNLLRRIKK